MSSIRRNNAWWIRFRPFGGNPVALRTNCQSRNEARLFEDALIVACRTSDYSWLSPVVREACIRMFRNQRWPLPDDLIRKPGMPDKELSLWEATEIFLNYPEVKESKSLWRHMISLKNLVDHFSKEQPVLKIGLKELRLYRVQRTTLDGKKPATVNREIGTLSRIFQVLIESGLADMNPVRSLVSLSERSSYIGKVIPFTDFRIICDRAAGWAKSLIETAFWSGMRRSEITELRRHHIRLERRMIYLEGSDTKEGRSKRVPIHRALVPVLEDVLKVAQIATDKVFTVASRPVRPSSLTHHFQKAAKNLEPRPRFHDLRHTWKTNALQCGIDEELREAILGHSNRVLSVRNRYGRISDNMLVEAIDKMVIDEWQIEDVSL